MLCGLLGINERRIIVRIFEIEVDHKAVLHLWYTVFMTELKSWS